MNILGLACFAIGYTLCYWAVNVLVDAYFRTGVMNPAPLSVLIGIPGAGAAAATPDQGAAQ